MQNFASQCLDQTKALLKLNFNSLAPDGTVVPVEGEVSRADEPGHAALAFGEYFRATGELSLYESGRTEATVTSFAVAGDGTECLETCATAEEEPAGEGSDGSDGGADGAVDEPDTVTEPKGGCATAPSAGLGAALVGLLGPLLIVLMGLFVLLIVFAMLQPIFEMNTLVR